ncbi:MAG: Mrp/NBP35 family ATP-binding protein [Eubacterium sp.]|nr:Mrp/NBP35 family ATP-binding protein [Eubacterium sp.]
MSDNLDQGKQEALDKAFQNTNVRSFEKECNKDSNVKKVIGVVSGKGGVGKSLVTSLMAVLANRKGLKTAIIDADITGPSIPKSFGIKKKAMGTEDSIIPVVSENGIEVMSINVLVEDETEPVIWRGPVIAGAVQQFWTDVIWGDIDVMFVDMPPGTGDVPLTVFQSLPVDGIIVVTSPQELVEMIVTKAVKMASVMHIPVLGLVENMSYFECPNCKEKHEIFGRSKVDEIASAFGIGSTARIPIDTKLTELVDEGKIENVDSDWLDDFFDEIIKA